MVKSLRGVRHVALRCDGGIIRGLFHHNRRATLGGQHGGNRRHHVHGAFCARRVWHKEHYRFGMELPGVSPWLS